MTACDDSYYDDSYYDDSYVWRRLESIPTSRITGE